MSSGYKSQLVIVLLMSCAFISVLDECVNGQLLSNASLMRTILFLLARGLIGSVLAIIAIFEIERSNTRPLLAVVEQVIAVAIVLAAIAVTAFFAYGSIGWEYFDLDQDGRSTAGHRCCHNHF